MKIVVVSCIFYLNIASFELKFCREYEGTIKHDFHPLRHCQRSNKTVIAYLNAYSAGDCAENAKEFRGLAFNYSPKHRQGNNSFVTIKGNETTDVDSSHEEFFNCEVLECPEYRNLSTVVNDTRYDYYTLYSHPPPSENSSCVPSVGMFMLFKERSNYSVAHNICTSVGGSLAHIASEVRNVALSRLLRISTNSSSKERTAYVGLNEMTRGEFLTSNSEPLKCFDFRAWANGHPAEVRKPGCVAITPESSWKVFNCNRKLMFICELSTSGPNPYVNNLKEECSVVRPNNRFMPKIKSKG